MWWKCRKRTQVIASSFLLTKGLMLVWMISSCIKMIYSKWKGNVKVSVGALNVKGFFFSSISNMSAVTGIYWLNGSRDHLSKKKQHNHKGIYFMICNEVQILPTTLNNQIKPNFPSLEDKEYINLEETEKACFASDPHKRPGSNSNALWYHPYSFLRKTKHETNHLFLQSKSLRRLKKWLAHRSPRCPKSSSWNVLSPRAQMSSATWDTTGYSSSLCRRLRSARGCSICQPVYALDIFKYINGPSVLPTGNCTTSFVTTIPQKVLQLSKSALHSSLLPSSKSLNSKEC